MGYREAFSAMPSEITEIAFVIYIEVNLEDSMRKDAERVVVPEGYEGPVDSNIVHGLSPKVRDGAYWGDDLRTLFDSDNWIGFGIGGRWVGMPAAIFDNRGAGCTDVFRRPANTWTVEETTPAIEKLEACLEHLRAVGW
jgi:hypothetical protein